jgi:hypothetical protein
LRISRLFDFVDRVVAVTRFVLPRRGTRRFVFCSTLRGWACLVFVLLGGKIAGVVPIHAAENDGSISADSAPQVTVAAAEESALERLLSPDVALAIWLDTAAMEAEPVRRILSAMHGFAREGGLRELARSFASDRTVLDGQFDTWRDVLELVDGAALFAHEIGVAARLEGPIPEVVALFRVPIADIESDRRLSTPLAGIDLAFARASIAVPELFSVENEVRSGVSFERFVVHGTPLALVATRQGDWIALSNSDRYLADAIERFFDPRLANPRAVATEGTRVWSASRIDLRRVSAFLERMFSPIPGVGEPDAAEGRLVVRMIGELRQLAHIEFRALGSRGVGEWQCVVELDAALPRSLLLDAILEQEPVDAALRHLPEGCGDYALVAGLDWHRVLDVSRAFRAIDAEAGRSELDERERRIQDRGFSFQNDFASWVDGSVAWLDLPPRAEDPGGIAWVIGTTRRFRAERRLDELLAALLRLAEARGQTLAIESQRADGGAGTYRVLRLASFPGIEPGIGLVPGALVLGTNAATALRVGAAWSNSAGEPLAEGSDGAAADSRVLARWSFDSARLVRAIAVDLERLGLVAVLSGSTMTAQDRTALGAALGRAGRALRALENFGRTTGWVRFVPRSHRVEASGSFEWKQNESDAGPKP